MLENYIKIAIRNISRNKIYVIINMFGMGVAMACCMTAYLLIAYNIEFDDYFAGEQVENIVKVVHHLETSEGKKDQSLVCPMVMAPQAKQDITGIKDFTRFYNESGIMSYDKDTFHENIRFADHSFFKMFPLALKYGSHKNFEDQKFIFLSEQLAKKYFAQKDPVGESMSVEFNGKKYEVVVGGVLDILPLNISFHIDALMRMEVYLDAYSIEPNDWSPNHSSSTLFKLQDINQRKDIAGQMTKYLGLINEKQNDAHSLSFELVPFKKQIIRSEVSQSNLRLPIPTIALFIFSTLATIILLIACFNLTNTTLALTGKRLKEIGVRKVVGSGRNQIVYQFLIEMVITVSLAIIAGLLMAQFIVPQFAAMWQLDYGLSDLNKLNVMLMLIILLFIAALLAGIYPALANSKFNPVELFKGNKGVKGTTYLSRTLLVAQFSLSIIVFIGGVTFTQNAAYQKTIDLGYDKEDILTVLVESEQEYNALKNRISANPQIKSIAGASNHIGPYTSFYNTVKSDTTIFKTKVYDVGIGYFNTVGLALVAGRDFIDGNQTDFESNVIVDENFVLNHNIANPIDAQLFYNDKPYRIIGVVENHLSGLKEGDDSEHIFTLAPPSSFKSMVVRTDDKDILNVRSFLEEEWKKIFPGKPFESKFQVDMIYEEADTYNKSLSQIFFFITILGCMLSASGIFALASLNVQKRTKEIGVRKVLGASVQSIIQLVNKEFTIILGLAVFLGSTGGYLLTSALLDELSAQHLEIGFVTVIICSVTIFAIGILATSGTILKTALTNPTESLRNE
ncbi:FtsX-like permease family protein [Chryseolinea sp. H1M3-3]|uniref:ABC transporter permease n=1 Tax=Chryseolinea sp. H1M3-3 TaxID=3034144 RepID=UPI0023EC6357|nr:FtsX-like permease family protein [Chryseolinea sp. H1M3-3]